MKFEGVSTQFSVDEGIVYFNSAGCSVLPKSVEEIGISSLQKKSKPWNGMGSDGDAEEIRRLFSSLINSPDPNNIAICPSTAFAMSMAAKNIVQMGVLHAGTCVLLLEKEMASGVYPWQEACKETSATLRVVEDPLIIPSSGGALVGAPEEVASWADQVIEQIDEDVSVIVLPAVHWCDGSLIDLQKIAEYLERIPLEHRPFLVIDGTQSIGALPFDVQKIKPTFVCCSVHKWLNCPYGMSLVYVDPSMHSVWEPLDHHERAREGAHEPAWDEVILMNNDTGEECPLSFVVYLLIVLFVVKGS